MLLKLIGAPLQSTADAQGEAPATVEQLLTNINEQLTMLRSNQQRNHLAILQLIVMVLLQFEQHLALFSFYSSYSFLH